MLMRTMIAVLATAAVALGAAQTFDEGMNVAKTIDYQAPQDPQGIRTATFAVG